jgi:hypothetical protein
MKLTLTTALSALVLSLPAFADTASPTPPAPSAPVSSGAKTDFTKPFIYDGLRRQVRSNPQDHPSVELKAGPAPGSTQPQP